MEETATCLRDRLLVRLLFHLGCRVSEALALKVEDIDFNQSVVTIKHLKSRIKLSCPNCGAGLGATHTYCPKCGNKVERALTHQHEYHRQRVLPVDTNTLSMLREYIHRGGPVIRDDSGDGLRLLQEHLGHVSFNTTAKYRKVAGEELKDWYDRLWKEEVGTDGA